MRINRRDDEGFTMLAVLASAFLVMALVLVGIGYAMVSVQRSRTSQDTRGALAAAQAGVQDYLSRLNNCERYFLASNNCPNINTAALTTVAGAVVPGTSGQALARYTQKVISTPLTAGSTGGVRLEVVGTVDGESRTLTVDLQRDGFLDYLYYTDYETFSPASTRRLFLGEPSFDLTSSSTNRTFVLNGSGAAKSVTFPKGVKYTLSAPTEDQITRGCQRYHYSTATSPARTTFPRTVTIGGSDVEIWPATNDSSPFDVASYFTCLTISFSGNDSFDGPLHSNDSLRLSGPVMFKKAVTTAWQTTGNTWYGDSDPAAGSTKPKYHAPLKMPDTATAQKDVAAANGCVYTGPTSIKFLSSGKMEVLSPNTAANTVNSGCATGSGNAMMSSPQVVSGPANGVVYVQSTTTANNCVTAFQKVSGDITDYDNNSCRAGDVFVQGDVSGQVTVVAEHNVVITDDIKYVGGLKTGTDVLGLIGQNNVAVWHPVKISNGAYVNINANVSRRIDAAIASVSNSFTVFNYSQGARIGTLNINGVILQRFRGPVATGSGTTTSSGYAKDYSYDGRLSKLPPPSFISPVNDPWQVNTLTEQ